MQEANGGAREHQDHRHNYLGKNRTDRRIDAAVIQYLLAQALVYYRALLIEDHPGHDHGANIGGDKIPISFVTQRQIPKQQRVQDRGRIGVSRQHGRYKSQFEQTDKNSDQFDPAVTP